MSPQTLTDHGPATRAGNVQSSNGLEDHELLYRFEGRLLDQRPLGHFSEGLRFENPFEGAITGGLLSGARMSGLDYLLVRPDGVAVIDAPETIQHPDGPVIAHARGYVMPSVGLAVPPLETIASPEFAWPSVPFAITGFVLYRTAVTRFEELNRVAGALVGEVDMSNGRLVVEARVSSRRP